MACDAHKGAKKSLLSYWYPAGEWHNYPNEALAPALGPSDTHSGGSGCALGPGSDPDTYGVFEENEVDYGQTWSNPLAPPPAGYESCRGYGSGGIPTYILYKDTTTEPSGTWPPSCTDGTFLSVHSDTGWVYNEDACTYERRASACPPSFPHFWPNVDLNPGEITLGGICIDVECPDGTCWCDLTCSCVDCEREDDPSEHGCQWDYETCEWVNCATCPDGQCWCELTQECVDCESLKPECADALHCVWSKTECVWVCDDPEVKCGGRAWLPYPACRCEAGGGSDLLEIGNGWLVRAYCIDNTIFVGMSFTAGATWNDVEVATGESGTSAPALTRDRWDTLWVAWHTGSGVSLESFLWRSGDLGATWEEVYTVAGRSYPRPCSTPARLLLLSHIGTAMVLHASEDGGATFGASIADAWTDALERRGDIRQDRRGLLHAVYEDTGGAVVHRWSSPAGEVWTDPVTLSSDGVGAEAAYAVGTERGFYAHFDEGVLLVSTTDETLSANGESVAVPLPEYQPQQLGTTFDRRGYPWVLGLVDEEPVVVVAENIYVEWIDPV